MIMRKRAELDTKNPPGQITNDITLGDYLDRKYPEEKKLTFDEWLLEFMCKTQPDDAWWWEENGVDKHDDYNDYKAVWKAAQENK